MARTVREWIGKTDDQPVPPRVKLRVFDSTGGICSGCFRKILGGMRWICDHKLALINGGENRESNLQPLCLLCNLSKTAVDVAQKSKTARVRLKHLGVRTRKGRPMPGSRDSPFKAKIGGGWERR